MSSKKEIRINKFLDFEMCQKEKKGNILTNIDALIAGWKKRVNLFHEKK